MKTVKPEVLRVLMHKPDSRDDDVLLAFSIWESEGLVLGKQQKSVLRGLSKPGSIVRIRAYIQNVEQRFRPTRIRRSQ